MKRLSFRPRPLDINKKLSIVTSRQELDGDEFVRGANSSSSPAVKDAEAAEAVLTSPAKKAAVGSEIPTPRFMVVNSYEKDYTRTFVQPQSYIRARPEMRMRNIVNMTWMMMMSTGLTISTRNATSYLMKS